MWQQLKKSWRMRPLTSPDYAFLFDEPPVNEWVSLDCETTGLDRKNDHILTIAAVKIVGNCIKSSERLELTICPPAAVNPESIRYHRLRDVDVQHGLTGTAAAEQLLHFIGARPIVGYNIKFDQDMLNRLVEPLTGVKLPNPIIDVAPMFHQYRQRQLGHGDIKLSFEHIIQTLALPTWPAHDAYNDALMTALIFLSLRDKVN